jgi:hypothetical protein
MRVHIMITDLFRLDGHAFAPGHEPTMLDWVRYYINENSEILTVVGSGLVSFWVTLIVLRRIVAVVRRALRDPHAEEEAAQEALRKLAEAEAQREPRVRRRAAPGAVAPERDGAHGGWDDMEPAPAGGYPGRYGGGPVTEGAQGYGAQNYGPEDYGAGEYGARDYGARDFGTQGYDTRGHDGQGYGAGASAPAADPRHAPRPGRFFAHRSARPSR